MMPRIDLHILRKTLTEDDYAIVREMVNHQTWRIYSKMPLSLLAAYVWRMVAFYTSTRTAHRIMKDSPFVGLNKQQVLRLNSIVDKVISTVPSTQWYSVRFAHLEPKVAERAIKRERVLNGLA
jgi:hypothetical protein